MLDSPVNITTTLVSPAAIRTTLVAPDAVKTVFPVGQGVAGTNGTDGVGLDPSTVLCGESILAGQLVNLYSDAGVPKVRLAKALPGFEAHAWSLDTANAGVTTRVVIWQINSLASGLTVGPQWLSSTAGSATSVPPQSSGAVQQRVGFATAANRLLFQPQIPITLSL